MSSTTVPMSTLCTIKSGKSDTKDAVENGEFAFFDRSKIVKKSSRYLYDCEALIIAGEGTEFLPKHYVGKFDLHQRAYAIHNFSESINVKYLFYYLHYLKDYLPSVAVGATVKSLRLRHFENLPVVLFPLAIQQKIVSKLDEIFAEIDKAAAATESNIKNVERLFQSYLTDSFKRDGDGWNEQELVKICTIFSDGDWIESKDQSDSGIRLIQTGNVGFGIFKARDTKARYISEDTFNRLRCTEIKEGDILVSRLPDPVGRACLLPKLELKSITAVDCTIIRVKDDLVNSKFLNFYFQASQYYEQVKKNITGATRQRISRSLLGKVHIPLPPLPTQRKIVEKLDIAFEAKTNSEKSYIKKLSEFASLKQSILKQAFNGELVKE